MPQLSVVIDDGLEERIELEQDRYPYDIDKSQIVRAALDEFLPEAESEEGNPTETATVTA